MVKISGIDTVVIDPTAFVNRDLTRVFYEVLPLGVSTVSFSEFYEHIMGKIPISLISEQWFLENLTEFNKKIFEHAKRALDVLLVSVLGVIFLAILPLVAFLIKIDSRGNIFYTQSRVGKNGKVFELIKFRSMVEGADKIGGSKEIGASSDTRQTLIGKFLRKTYLDELPQIINIFKGEMSIVGPRPERPEFVENLKIASSFLRKCAFW